MGGEAENDFTTFLACFYVRNAIDLACTLEILKVRQECLAGHRETTNRCVEHNNAVMERTEYAGQNSEGRKVDKCWRNCSASSVGKANEAECWWKCRCKSSVATIGKFEGRQKSTALNIKVEVRCSEHRFLKSHSKAATNAVPVLRKAFTRRAIVARSMLIAHRSSELIPVLRFNRNSAA